MTAPTSLAAYSDCAAVLNAIRGTGGEYRLPSAKAATAFRLRCNQYRARLRKALGKASPFDHLILRIESSRPEVIIFDCPQIEGTLHLPDGTETAADPAPPEFLDPAIAGPQVTTPSGRDVTPLAELDPLEEEARKLAESLGLGRLPDLPSEE